MVYSLNFYLLWLKLGEKKKKKSHLLMLMPIWSNLNYSMTL